MRDTVYAAIISVVGSVLVAILSFLLTDAKTRTDRVRIMTLATTTTLVILFVSSFMYFTSSSSQSSNPELLSTTVTPSQTSVVVANTDNPTNTPFVLAAPTQTETSIPSATPVPPTNTATPPLPTDTPVPPTPTPVPPTPTPTPILPTKPGTVLRDGETWYVPGWSLTVSNFDYTTIGSAVHFELRNLTGRTVVFPGSAKMRLVTDSKLSFLPCLQTYRGIMAFAQTPDLDQQEIVQDGKLEWDWSFGGHDSSYCYPATFASKDRIITLIVDNIADLIKGAKWQTDIPRP